MISKRKNIIVIGGNAAGPAAAAKAKRVNPASDVTMLETSNFISTGTCELPYVLSGEVDDIKRVIFFNAASFEEKKGVKTLVMHKAENIDRRRKNVAVRDLSSGELKKLSYDKLILATGSKPRLIPDLPGNLENVFTLKSVADYLRIKKFIDTREIQNAAIIGAGYIGLESAEAFNSLGIKVNVFEREILPMPGAEPEVSMLIKGRLERNDVRFFGGSEFSFSVKNNRVVSVKYESEFVEVDIVLVSVGVIPNNELAVSSGLKIGNSGGIRVNSRLQTSDPDIYAAGDNIEVKNSITNKYQLLPIATLAHEFGHIAGGNAAGENECVKPAIKNIAVKIFDDIYSSVGLTEFEAKMNNFAFSSVSEVTHNLVRVMPRSRKVFGKLIFEIRTGRILGGSFLGGPEAVNYADFLSGMIYLKASTEDVERINFNYTPPASPFINLLSLLARKARRTK